MHSARTLGLAISIAISFGCGSKKAAGTEKPTREECTQVSQHIAGLIVADMTANPDALWDALHGEEAPATVPPEVTKDHFKEWLDSPAGKTWLMQRHGQAIAATQEGIDGCIEHGTKALVTCLLAAKNKADVDACDEPHGGSGSATPK
jgi:hypothetical protein